MNQNDQTPNPAKSDIETSQNSSTTGSAQNDTRTGDKARPCARGACRTRFCGSHDSHGPHGMACRRGSGFHRLLAVVLLVAAGVMIGKAVIGHHHHEGPWSYGPAQVSAGQTVPMGKLLDDIGATPEQRQKAESALHK